MCGVIFILSKNKLNIINNIFKSLELIQNRGYDSMGICYLDNTSNGYEIIKYASTNNNDCYNLLKNKFNKDKITSHIGVGHTRWATHGAKTDINAHPHISQNNNIILVHNGIINNFYEIKLKLLKHGYVFYSETDTEVIANLIEYYILYENQNIESAIKSTTNNLDGTWALVIIYTKNIDRYYITRKGSPLLLGNDDNYIICTSEISGFIGLLYNYIIIDNNDIIKIENNEYTSICNNINYDTKIIPNDIVNLKNDYNHWMIKEIMEQPETIQKAFNYGGRIINDCVKLKGLDNIKNILETIELEYLILLGCGTSFHAGLLGEIYFNKTNTFINCMCYNACEFNENNLPKISNYRKVVCIFLSQSGETIDLYNCLNLCKSKGCLTIGVINKVDSLLARNVDCGVYLNAGTEISVASTKSFTSMIVILSLMQIWFDNNAFQNKTILDSLRLLPNLLTQILYDIVILRSIDNLKKYIINNNIKSIFILGKNKLYPIAKEACLKIKEVCYIHAESFSAGSLKHGPFALLDNTNLTILLIDYNDINNYNSLKSTYYEIKTRETNIIVITNNKIVISDLNIDEDKAILIYNLRHYNEIIFIIILQYLAYVISVDKGIDPDKPRNLAKVVTVE